MNHSLLYLALPLLALCSKGYASHLGIAEFAQEHFFKHGNDDQEETNILIAGLVNDASEISTHVLDFIVEMSCNHYVRMNILAATGYDEFQAKYDHIRQDKYRRAQCAPVDIVRQPKFPILAELTRVRRIQDLREYQKSLLHEALDGVEDLDTTAIVLVDFDLAQLPPAAMVMGHAKDIVDGNTRVDALCSNGVLGYGDQSKQYYDTYATILHPDIFVYPIEWREEKKYWPPENANVVVSPEHTEGSFTTTSLFNWLQEQGRIDVDAFDTRMNPVPVQSCFGGLAVYRASKYLDFRCTYSHERQAIVNIKYKSRVENEICEHVLWKNCMSSIDPNFVVAIQPDMITTYLKEPIAQHEREAATLRGLEETNPSSASTTPPTSQRITMIPTFPNTTITPIIRNDTMAPTFQDNTVAPTFVLPSRPPSIPTASPTFQNNTIAPIFVLPSRPSSSPTAYTPSQTSPSPRPSRLSAITSSEPTGLPSKPSSLSITSAPSLDLNPSPSSSPTLEPSFNPTSEPSMEPYSSEPSSHLTKSPSLEPSEDLSTTPTVYPTSTPSRGLSSQPSLQLSSIPTSSSSFNPSTPPSIALTSIPSVSPSSSPSIYPTMVSSVEPSPEPSSTPTDVPSLEPSTTPTSNPTSKPSSKPSLGAITEPSPSPTPRIRGVGGGASSATVSGIIGANISIISMFSTVIVSLSFLAL